MAVKKSELYSSLWKSCDELRGGMDASQYKDYILNLLFIKYVTDKYENDPDSIITIPRGVAPSENDLKTAETIEKKTLKDLLSGGSFNDMISLKGKSFIGEGINVIFGNFQKANEALTKGITFADFNEKAKLGEGRAMTETLSKLVGIFQSKFDFSKNKIGGDDILGDAYEFLMRHFATESGKSKGQFYTPSEVSRILAKIIGINPAENGKSVYDPTCGSGSLLLKVSDEARHNIALYGQEMDNATFSLAKMNMILHGINDAEFENGNTISTPKFLNGQALQTFDFIVANPPFSTKAWSSGVSLTQDPYNRFVYGTPPDKNGDYAFLPHILASMKPSGKGAVILPHGVLFRGNAEAEIRKNLIKRGYIKGIIGLPANLFYGTGIPACIIVMDKQNAQTREGIFMVDASKGFIKDGNKNRLREQDIHKIVDIFNSQSMDEKYARFVPNSEIELNDFNLNIPRYIDNQDAEDRQSIEGHLKGGIPDHDLTELSGYWDVYPSLKNTLFQYKRAGFSELQVSPDMIKQTIFEHHEFLSYSEELHQLLENWIVRFTPILKDLVIGLHPKDLIELMAEDILLTFSDKKLIDRYDVFQHLMNYWADSLQDDVYIIATDGWTANPDLIPEYLMVERFFQIEKKKNESLETERDETLRHLDELLEEHTTEDGFFEPFKNDKGIINKKDLEKRAKDLKKETSKPLFKAEDNADLVNELLVLEQYNTLILKDIETKKFLKIAQIDLQHKIKQKYQTLTETEIKTLVVDDKWMKTLRNTIKTEMDRISQRLTQRLKELSELYVKPLPELNTAVLALEKRVMEHLKKMGFA